MRLQYYWLSVNDEICTRILLSVMCVNAVILRIRYEYDHNGKLKWGRILCVILNHVYLAKIGERIDNLSRLILKINLR